MHATTRIGVVAGLAMLAVTVTGCNEEVEKVFNQGRETSCRDYVNQDVPTKRITVAKAIEQQSGNEPSTALVDTKITQLDVLCATQRNIDTPIKNADVAGIFLNK
ncbi:hypothetical protein [Nocardia lasii]|uniref:Acid stress chaperone HdeA n=1 Tax=Nocardia lasii TaxID=1616107 RepID=A0ABW1JLB5_9NOCA